MWFAFGRGCGLLLQDMPKNAILTEQKQGTGLWSRMAPTCRGLPHPAFDNASARESLVFLNKNESHLWLFTDRYTHLISESQIVTHLIFQPEGSRIILFRHPRLYLFRRPAVTPDSEIHLISEHMDFFSGPLAIHVFTLDCPWFVGNVFGNVMQPYLFFFIFLKFFLV